MAVYYDEFSSHSDLPYGDNNPKESQLVYAGYTYEDYSGSALIVFVREGKWYENNDGHCSCYGLDEWAPEETSREALLMRTHWPGLIEAVEGVRLDEEAAR